MSLGYWETLGGYQSSGGTLTNSTTRTSLTASGAGQVARPTLNPGKFKQVGDILLLEASGIISTLVTSPGTFTFDVAFGGTATISSGALPLNIVAQTSMPWYLRIMATLQTPGSTASFNFIGFWLSPAGINTAAGATGPGPGGTLLPYSSTATGASDGSSSWNSTISQQLDLYGTWSVANAANSITLHQLSFSMMTSTGY